MPSNTSTVIQPPPPPAATPNPATAPAAAPSQSTENGSADRFARMTQAIAEQQTVAPRSIGARPDAPKPAAEKPALKPEPDKQEAPKPEPGKPEAAPAPKETEPPKSGVEKILGTKPENPEQPTDKPLTRWKELREKEQRLETEIMPELEKLRTELQDLRSRVPEDVDKELTELRQFRYMHDIRSSPEYVEAIVKPYNRHNGLLSEIGQYLAIEQGVLAEAVNEPNPILRAEKVESALRTSEREVSASLIAKATDAADHIHELAVKGQEMEAKAEELRNANAAKKTYEEAQRTKLEAEQRRKAADEVYAAIESKLGPVLARDEVAQAVKAARYAETHNEKAYQAQAGELLPYLVEEGNQLRAKVAELEGILADRNRAKPGAGVSQPSEPEAVPREVALANAISAYRQGRGV